MNDKAGNPQSPAPPAGTPSLLIRLGFEARPVVAIDAMTESESDRLLFWISSQSQLRELLEQALELAAAAEVR